MIIFIICVVLVIVGVIIRINIKNNSSQSGSLQEDEETIHSIIEIIDHIESFRDYYSINIFIDNVVSMMIMDKYDGLIKKCGREQNLDYYFDIDHPRDESMYFLKPVFNYQIRGNKRLFAERLQQLLNQKYGYYRIEGNCIVKEVFD